MEIEIDDVGDFDGVEALLKAAGIKDREPKKENDDHEEEEDSGEEDSGEEDSDEEDSGDAGDDSEDDDAGDDSEEDAGKDGKVSKRVVIDPEADAYVTINGKEIKVSELAKTFGKDAELASRTIETEAAKAATEARATKYVVGLEAMLKRAAERAAPYANINFLALSKDPNVSVEEITALSNEAQKAYDDVQYLKNSLDATVAGIHEERHKELMRQGQEAWRFLSDPEKGIKDWNEDKYKEVSSFALGQGIPKAVVDGLVDPHAIKLLHMAMLYQKGQTATVVTKKVNKTPKKILKGNVEEVARKVRAAPGGKAFDRLRKSGSPDDAMEALLARMAD